MKKIIEYFSSKHILVNFFVVLIIIGAVYFWDITGKEDMPNMTFDFARVSAHYAGATAEEVDFHITGKIEEALEGIDGIKQIESTSSQGSCSVFISLEPGSSNRNTVVSEITDAVTGVNYPEDVETPNVREFKSNRRAVIDIAMYLKDTDILTSKQREHLQSYSDTLADRLMTLREVSEVSTSNYSEQYIKLDVNPKKLAEYSISLSEIRSILRNSNLKQPVGTLQDETNTLITFDAQLDELSKIRNLIVRANFEGQPLRLRELVDVSYFFDEQDSITKINGNEGITLRITKTASIGILEAISSIKKVVNTYKEAALSNTEIELCFLDDESESIRNRLSIISMNGLFGFILILIVLFIFLDAKSGLWVAFGIPFTLASTMIISSLLGHSINNMTLAAVIIVMGMVVDDAIVVAENVSRLRSSGMLPANAVTEGTHSMLIPIVASITTTCAAFIPLFFFQGRFGIMIKFIPPIIFAMLFSSLFEAIFILPSHLQAHFPGWIKKVFTFGLLHLYEKRKKINKEKKSQKDHWFMAVESVFGKLLKFLLRFKLVTYIVLLLLMAYTLWFFFGNMKYTMFPREETTQVNLFGSTREGTLKEETEKRLRKVEDIIIPYLDKEVVGVTTRIARRRWGGVSRENEFSMMIEIVPKDKRKKSTKQLISEWEKELEQYKEDFERISFSTGWFGHSSGSPIDIIVQETDNNRRREVAEKIVEYLKKMPSLANPEIEEEQIKPEYVIEIDRELAERLDISIESVVSALRTILEGSTIFDVLINNEEIEVKLTIDSSYKNDIKTLLSIPVQNSRGYFIPVNKIVKVRKGTAPATINKLNGKRILHVYADLAKDTADVTETSRNQPPGRITRDRSNQEEKKSEEAKVEKLDLPVNMTPLEIAAHIEEYLFPAVIKDYPTANPIFGGEVEESREAGNNFLFAVILTLLLIYIILALAFNSILKPFIILIAIPFGVVGIILALQAHGMLIYGFFAIIGALGLAGVVVNDSIVLITKLEKEYDNPEYGATPREKVANISKTRLRAVLLTTLTTVAGLMPTAYGVFGYDSMLAEMMLTMSWGLIFGTIITLILIPSIYCTMKEVKLLFTKRRSG